MVLKNIIAIISVVCANASSAHLDGFSLREVNTELALVDKTTDVYDLVTLCKHGECLQDDNIRVGAGADYPNMFSFKKVGNDSLTRVLIPKGMSFECFEHVNYEGWSRSFGSKDKDMDVSLSGMGLNDVVSSFKIRNIPIGHVTLCKHYNCYDGLYKASVGNWKSMPNQIGNDTLSRVYVPKGFKLKYFQHANFQGFSKVVGSEDESVDVKLGGHNDVVSSFIISVF